MRFALIRLLIAAAPASAETIALSGCSVVDVRAGSIRANQTILVRGERIAEVGQPRVVRVPSGSRVIRCAGKFAIPGLWDMHVHVGEIEENWFPLYLANGVPGLREMAASEANAPHQRSYQEDVAGGKRLGPELLWTLFPLDAPAIGQRERRSRDGQRSG